MSYPSEYNQALGERPVKYMSERDALVRAVKLHPHDQTPRLILADYLDENPHLAHPDTVPFLRGADNRGHEGPYWISVAPDGRVHAGKKWSMAEIRAAHKDSGGHWFDRGTMRFFGTRLHGQPHSGPGGVYFVHSGDNFWRSAREWRVVKYNPETNRTESAGPDGHENPYPDRESAFTAARTLAATHPPTPTPSE